MFILFAPKVVWTHVCVYEVVCCIVDDVELELEAQIVRQASLKNGQYARRVSARLGNGVFFRDELVEEGVVVSEDAIELLKIRFFADVDHRDQVDYFSTFPSVRGNRGLEA